MKKNRQKGGNNILFFLFLPSDNGPHYNNTAVLTYLSEVNSVFNVNLLEYNNFEAGEGKTALDTHFAHISHKIVRYVRVGNDLETGEELGQLVQVNDTFKNSVRSHLHVVCNAQLSHLLVMHVDSIDAYFG